MKAARSGRAPVPRGIGARPLFGRKSCWLISSGGSSTPCSPLLVVTLVTFGIFFMVPKITGSDPALLYIGKTADAASLEGIRTKLGLDDPIIVQYGKFLKGLVAGRDYANGNDVTHCPAPCMGYSFKTEQEVTSRCCSATCRSRSRWRSVRRSCGCSSGVATGVISALRRGTLLDRAVMSGALAGVSLPIYFTGLLASAIFVYWLGWLPNIDYTPFTENPALLGARPDPALDHAGVPVRRHLRPAHPGEHAGDPGRGLHPYGAREGPAGAHGHRQARAALRPDPACHGLRPGPRRPARRRGPDRGGLQPARPRLPGADRRSAATTCR